MKYIVTGFTLFIIQLAFVVVLQAQTTQQDSLRELARQISILVEELENQKLDEVSERRYESKFGLGPAASQVYFLRKSGPSIAGYGEVVYENHATENEDGSPSNKQDKIDYLRHIIYLGYRFNERFIFNAELEFEHAKTGDGQPGSVSVEFGYIDAMLQPHVNIRAGMLLVPVGIINEYHEPATYWGALRPETEAAIIPSTWRANGIGVHGGFGNGFGYRLLVVEGLNASNFSADGIRSGRQNGAKAIAEDFAVTGRFDYTGIPGLNAGVSFYTGNSGQTMTGSDGSGLGVRTSIIALHSLYSRRGFDARFLYAHGKIDEVARLNTVLGYSGEKSIGEMQRGYYFTFAYDILQHLDPYRQATLQPFIQYESLNTQSRVPTGATKNAALDRTNLTLGFVYKPIPNVGFKADYVNRSNAAESATDQFNLAMVYMF